MGKVYLVGAGPGAADLLTLRAVRVLEQADIVFHDALVQADVLALAPQAQLKTVGKRCGKHSTAQRFINKMLIDAARAYRLVVRLKGGDPMLFGRAQEEIDALTTAGIPVEVVPGVTAALAGSAQLGVSLTQRAHARSVAFVTPRVAADEAQSNWATAAAAADTSVLYMAAGQAGIISAALIAAGKPVHTPVAVIENASLPQAREYYLTLAQLADFDSGRLSGPALVIVGEVLAKRQALAFAARSQDYAARRA